MEESQKRRIAEQHVLADKLLGLDAVPCDLGVIADVGAPSTIPSGGTGVIGQPGGGQGAISGSGHAGVGIGGGMPQKPMGGAVSNPTSGPAASGGMSAVEPIKVEDLGRDEKVVRLEQMYEGEVKDCRKCALARGRTNAVFGEGDVDAGLMFVGEGPGYFEDVQGRPFVGKSGELLDKQIAAIGLTREQVYIANVVKCRPPNNRTPVIDEVEACRDYLQRQIAIIRPKVIVTLGGPAAKLLLDTKEGITRLRGRWFEYKGVDPSIPVMPTFHPAYLLRQYTRDNRMKVWSDLKEALTKM
ncbi:uracil-DNA glycosylase [Planctomycetota bacterium]|nr:uracil-DNA glycosylase [Planctomycetota bacterium]